MKGRTPVAEAIFDTTPQFRGVCAIIRGAKSLFLEDCLQDFPKFVRGNWVKFEFGAKIEF